MYGHKLQPYAGSKINIICLPAFPQLYSNWILILEIYWISKIGYIMTSKSTSQHQTIQKNVMLQITSLPSNLRYDVKSTSGRQNVCMTSKVWHDVKKYVMTSHCLGQCCGFCFRLFSFNIDDFMHYQSFRWAFPMLNVKYWRNFVMSFLCLFKLVLFHLIWCLHRYIYIFMAHFFSYGCVLKCMACLCDLGLWPLICQLRTLIFANVMNGPIFQIWITNWNHWHWHST